MNPSFNWGRYPDNLSVSCYTVVEYYRLVIQFMQRALKQVDSSNSKYNTVWKLSEINRLSRYWLDQLSDQRADEIYKEIKEYSRLPNSDSSIAQFQSIGLKQDALLKLENTDLFSDSAHLVDDLTNLLSEVLPIYVLLDGMREAVHSNENHHCRLQDVDRKLLDQLYEPIKTAISELTETCALALYGARINTMQLQQKSSSIMSQAERMINQRFPEGENEVA
jgi:hypothetical protein